METFPCYWLFVRWTTGHRLITLAKASDAELWWSLWCAPEQVVEQTIEMPVIWEAMPLIVTPLQWFGSLLCITAVINWRCSRWSNMSTSGMGFRWSCEITERGAGSHQGLHPGQHIDTLQHTTKIFTRSALFSLCRGLVPDILVTTFGVISPRKSYQELFTDMTTNTH